MRGNPGLCDGTPSEYRQLRQILNLARRSLQRHPDLVCSLVEGIEFKLAFSLPLRLPFGLLFRCYFRMRNRLKFLDPPCDPTRDRWIQRHHLLSR